MALKLASYGPALSADEVFLIDSALAGNSQPQWNFYFSRVRFTTTVSTTPFVYTIAPQTVSAFNYGVGGSATTAGISTTATAADTSIQNAGQTINSEFVLVRGVSIFINGQSELLLAKALAPVTSVTVKVGPVSYQLGTPDMSPGWGGLTGMSESNIVPMNITGANATYATNFGGFSNGTPMAGNTVSLPRAILWMPPGAGNAANFTCNLQSWASVAQLSNFESGDVTGPPAWTHPAATSVYVDYVVALDHVPFYLT